MPVRMTTPTDAARDRPLTPPPSSDPPNEGDSERSGSTAASNGSLLEAIGRLHIDNK